MTMLREQVESHSFLDTTCAASPLRSVGLSDEGLGETTDLSLLVESHLPVLSRINDSCNVRDGDTSFGDVPRMVEAPVS